MNWVKTACAAVTALGLMTPTMSADASDFYQGQKINFIIGSSGSGGSSDTYSRFLASHMSRFIAGNPTIIPQIMPGAGGIRSANFLYNIAPKDGLTIGMLDQAVYLSQILGTPELKVDATKFNWLGRLINNTSVLIVRSDAQVKKTEDIFAKEVIVSASGTASRLNWNLLNNVVGTKIKMISGYKGTTEARLAMMRGEIDGLSMPWFDIKDLDGGSWLAEKKINMILQTGVRKHKELPDLPRMIDLAKNDEDRQLIYLFSLPNDIGRSIVAPPGLPTERVAELRKAFMDTINDPTFRSEAARAKLELDTLTGEELQQVVTGSGKFPESLIKRAQHIAEMK